MYIEKNMEKLENLKKLRILVDLKEIIALKKIISQESFIELEGFLASKEVSESLMSEKLAKVEAIDDFQSYQKWKTFNQLLKTADLEQLLQLDELEARQIQDPRNSLFRERLKPVVIYLKNGNEYTDVRQSGKTIIYQAGSPLNTVFQVRDAFTRNCLDKIREFIEVYAGEYIVLSLPGDENIHREEQKQKKPCLPLGWTLSKTAQRMIDNRIEEIMDSKEIKDIGKLLEQFDWKSE